MSVDNTDTYIEKWLPFRYPIEPVDGESARCVTKTDPRQASVSVGKAKIMNTANMVTKTKYIHDWTVLHNLTTPISGFLQCIYRTNTFGDKARLKRLPPHYLKNICFRSTPHKR